MVFFLYHFNASLSMATKVMNPFGTLSRKLLFPRFCFRSSITVIIVLLVWQTEIIFTIMFPENDTAKENAFVGISKPL